LEPDRRGVEELRRVNYDRLEALILTLWPGGTSTAV